MLGLITEGVTTVMIHAAQSEDRLAAEVAELRLAAVVGEDQFWPAGVCAAASAAGTVRIVLPDGLAGEVSVEAADNAPPRESADPGVALELLSSGTTGPPKRVPIGWHTLEAALGSAHGTALFGGEPPALSGTDLPPAVSGLSLGNIGGIYMMLPSALIGQPIVMLDRFAVEPWVRAVKLYRPEILSVQPTGLRMILDAQVPPQDIASLTTIVSGASKLDPDLQDSFEQRYGIRVFGAYGATETCGSIVVWTDELYDRYRHTKRGSVGKPIPGVALRVVQPASGDELPTGQTGLLHARVDRVGPDWIETTDLAWIDEDGFVYVTGRADDAIDRGGFSIPPETVADVLRQHSSVSDASVVGLPDGRLGEVPVAAVELAAGASEPDEAELIKFARARLLSYQVPVRIVCVDELPRNASLKVMAPAVRALFDGE
jgi:long-chain acyl-CoA synthetase